MPGPFPPESSPSRVGFGADIASAADALISQPSVPLVSLAVMLLVCSDSRSGRDSDVRSVVRPAWEAFSALVGQGFFGGGSRKGITQYARCRLGFWYSQGSIAPGGRGWTPTATDRRPHWTMPNPPPHLPTTTGRILSGRAQCACHGVAVWKTSCSLVSPLLRADELVRNAVDSQRLSRALMRRADSRSRSDSRAAHF